MLPHRAFVAAETAGVAVGGQPTPSALEITFALLRRWDPHAVGHGPVGNPARTQAQSSRLWPTAVSPAIVVEVWAEQPLSPHRRTARRALVNACDASCRARVETPLG